MQFLLIVKRWPEPGRTMPKIWTSRLSGDESESGPALTEAGRSSSGVASSLEIRLKDKTLRRASALGTFAPIITPIRNQHRSKRLCWVVAMGQRLLFTSEKSSGGRANIAATCRG
eukprot:935746-Rhodomonas_salina.2